MLEKRTIVDRIEILRDGTMQVQVGLLLVEDGIELAAEWHRTVVEPGADFDAQLAAVNAHLATMNRAALMDADVAYLKTIAAAVHTPDKVVAFAARQATQGRV